MGLEPGATNTIAIVVDESMTPIGSATAVQLLATPRPSATSSSPPQLAMRYFARPCPVGSHIVHPSLAATPIAFASLRATSPMMAAAGVPVEPTTNTSVSVGHASSGSCRLKGSWCASRNESDKARNVTHRYLPRADHRVGRRRVRADATGRRGGRGDFDSLHASSRVCGLLIAPSNVRRVRPSSAAPQPRPLDSLAPATQGESSARSAALCGRGSPAPCESQARRQSRTLLQSPSSGCAHAPRSVSIGSCASRSRLPHLALLDHGASASASREWRTTRCLSRLLRLNSAKRSRRRALAHRPSASSSSRRRARLR